MRVGEHIKFALVLVGASAIGIAGDVTHLGQRGAKLALLAFVVLTNLHRLWRR